MPKNKGFTALELMVTIGIIAIIAAIGIPAYTKYIPKYKLSKDVTNLKADLEMAKLTAKRENTCISVMFTDTEYTIYRDNSDAAGQSCNKVKNANESIVEYQKLSPGITFAAPDAPATDLKANGAQFKGNGEADAGGIKLKSYGGGGSKAIDVSFLGRIRIL